MSASSLQISFRPDPDQRMSHRMIAVSVRVGMIMLPVLWLLLTVCDAANRRDAKRQDQSNGKEGDEAAGSLPEGTDLPPPPPKPTSKEKSTDKEVAGECLVPSQYVETQAHETFVLACPVTPTKSCAMHTTECCCMSHFLSNPASVLPCSCLCLCS